MSAAPGMYQDTDTDMAKQEAKKRTSQMHAGGEGETDGPILDMNNAAVKKMIRAAKKRGFVTYDELNEVLPSEEFSSEQI